MSVTGTAVLRITDGTTSVDLRDTGVGFWLKEWLPEIAIGKNDGVWLDSPIAPGRRMVYRQLGNAVETFTLAVGGATQDMMIRKLRKLFALLEQAVEYWTSDTQSNPVWIEAKSRHETNNRYALICNWRLTGVNDPFAQPFETNVSRLAAMDELVLVIERQHWLKNEPGTGTPTKLSAMESYNGRNFGNVDEDGIRQPTPEREVYFANLRSPANLTHIFRYDASVPSYSANLLDSALPYNIFPDPVAVGDMVYFGIESSLDDSAPFRSLVFDFSVSNDSLSVVMESYDTLGATWARLEYPYWDNLYGFGATGVGALFWRPAYEDPPGNQWGPTVINGITAWWIRFRVDGVTDITSPVQQNRDIYTISWPYVELQGGENNGDLSARLRLKFFNGSAMTSYTYFSRPCSKLIFGSRKTNRGENFTAYLNFSDKHNDSGISVDRSGDAIFVNYEAADTSMSPVGRCITIPGGNKSGAASITLDSTIADEYVGTYRAFLRGGCISDPDTYIVEMSVWLGDYQRLTSTITKDGFQEYGGPASTIDMGKITIPNIGAMNEINFKVALTTTTDELYLYDLILIPVDEFAAELYQAEPNSDGANYDQAYVGRRDVITYLGLYLDADYISFPKDSLQLILRQEESSGDDPSAGFWTPIINNEFSLMPDERLRLWFLVLQYYGTDRYQRYASYQLGGNIQIETAQRYFALRGNE